MVIRCCNPSVYEGINTTTVLAFPPILSLSSIMSSEQLAAVCLCEAKTIFTGSKLFHTLPLGNVPHAIMVKNYKLRGTFFFFHTPDMEHMIKECKFEGHLRPIGPVFHALIHIKDSQARLLKANTV